DHRLHYGGKHEAQNQRPQDLPSHGEGRAERSQQCGDNGFDKNEVHAPTLGAWHNRVSFRNSPIAKRHWSQVCPPDSASSIMTATAPFADRRTFCPSTSATSTKSIK